jgi:sec-independent protein translocase protein TatA
MFRNPTTDVIIVLVIVLLFFGPKRLPILGRELGRGMREFKDSITGDRKDPEEEEEKPAITRVSGQPDEGAELRGTPAPEAKSAAADAGSETRS